ncbi:MAG: right-handed parallel beta-helix repeat-containing protein [Deltaproteobacteria bacterium]|nr:right-handed parallel beta-helix repeat-containing protein [Deltaproteobacteria bacterium]
MSDFDNLDHFEHAFSDTLLGALLAAGCSSESQEPGPLPVPCSAENTVAGVCAGVPAGALCDQEICATSGCSQVAVVGNDAELTSALAGAAAGSCVALRPGSYAEARLPAGVSLLGRGADFVTVGLVELGAGDGAAVRGLGVGAGGIKIDGATNAKIEAVRIGGSAGNGVEITAGSSVTIVGSTVQGSGKYGVSAFDAARISIDKSIIAGSKGPGLWAQCQGGCKCAGTKIEASVTASIIRDNKIVGVSLVGAKGKFDAVDIAANTVDPSFTPGGGLSVSGCSELDASGVRVLDNTNFGVLIDDSSATLSGSVEISRNLLGIWVQHIGKSGAAQVALESCTLAGNTGVGVGIDGASSSVTIAQSVIRDTSLIDLPVLVGGVSAGAKKVGDGLNWLGVSQVSIQGLTVSGSARQSVLIDGAVADGSTIADAQLEGGDEGKGILQQNLADGGLKPTMSGTTPALQTSADEQFAVPQSVTIPPQI